MVGWILFMSYVVVFKFEMSCKLFNGLWILHMVLRNYLVCAKLWNGVCSMLSMGWTNFAAGGET